VRLGGNFNKEKKTRVHHHRPRRLATAARRLPGQMQGNRTNLSPWFPVHKAQDGKEKAMGKLEFGGTKEDRKFLSKGKGEKKVGVEDLLSKRRAEGIQESVSRRKSGAAGNERKGKRGKICCDSSAFELADPTRS